MAAIRATAAAPSPAKILQGGPLGRLCRALRGQEHRCRGSRAKCEVQVAYAIGVARPVSVLVDTFGTGKIADDKIAELVEKHFDLRPKGIIQALDLLRPIYAKTAAYGHFGRDEPEFCWEATDKVAALRADAGKLTLCDARIK